MNPPQSCISSPASILLYLAEKIRRPLFRRISPVVRCLSWLFWQMGSAPNCWVVAFGHFYAYCPGKIRVPINRYAMEVSSGELDVAGPSTAPENSTWLGCLPASPIWHLAVYGGVATGGRFYNGPPSSRRAFLITTFCAGLRRSVRRPQLQRGRMVNPYLGRGVRAVAGTACGQRFDAVGKLIIMCELRALSAKNAGQPIICFSFSGLMQRGWSARAQLLMAGAWPSMKAAACAAFMIRRPCHSFGHAQLIESYRFKSENVDSVISARRTVGAGQRRIPTPSVVKNSGASTGPLRIERPDAVFQPRAGAISSRWQYRQ